MKKPTVVALVVILALGALAILLLKAYSLDLIQAVVQNAAIQKAPPGYGVAKVRQRFAVDRATAKRLKREAGYREALMRASQRLEKVQQLDASELDSLLGDLDQAAGTSLP